MEFIDDRHSLTFNKIVIHIKYKNVKILFDCHKTFSFHDFFIKTTEYE